MYDSKKGKPLYIQTPEMCNVFGVIKRKNYYELLLPLGGINCLMFKQFLNNLQNKILMDANLNRREWFKDQKSVKFIPIIKEINKDATTTMEQTEELDKCGDGIIKIKITNSTIIRRDHNEIGANEIRKNGKIRMILQVYAIWVNNNMFGIYLKPEIIEEKNSYKLNFIEEDKVIFESDNEDEESLKDEDSDDENNNDKNKEKNSKGDSEDE